MSLCGARLQPCLFEYGNIRFWPPTCPGKCPAVSRARIIDPLVRSSKPTGLGLSYSLLKSHRIVAAQAAHFAHEFRIGLHALIGAQRGYFPLG
jgi:hypothetical protein